MKDEVDIDALAGKVPWSKPTGRPFNTYEQGIRDALDWVLEEMDEEDATEFETQYDHLFTE